MKSPDATSLRDRKAEHIRLALEKRMQLDVNYFEDYRFDHVALPEIDRDEIDLSTSFLGKKLKAPFLVSCMTGGTEMAAQINRRLAEGAEAGGVALGVGSQRKALEDPEQVGSFQVREQAPTIPLLANLGAIQLNYGFGLAECRAAVEMIDGDALVLHLNPLQEAIQPEGQCNFAGLLPKIGEVAEGLDVPLIVKEVGNGISGPVAEKLKEQGVTIVDTAGVGGTSWARIEGKRADDEDRGDLFADWGVPTPEALEQLREIGGLTVIASGGVRNGVDAAKAVALGADLVGMAFPFLEAAMESAEAVADRIRRAADELRICMFCLGARNLAELARVPLRERSRR